MRNAQPVVMMMLEKPSGERNPATLHEVLAGVDEDGPVRNKT